MVSVCLGSICVDGYEVGLFCGHIAWLCGFGCFVCFGVGVRWLIAGCLLLAGLDTYVRLVIVDIVCLVFTLGFGAMLCLLLWCLGFDVLGLVYWFSCVLPKIVGFGRCGWLLCWVVWICFLDWFVVSFIWLLV